MPHYEQELDFVPKKSAHAIISAIVMNLFTPEGGRLDKEMVEINRKNLILNRSEADGFIHQGQPYLSAGVSRRGAVKIQLHTSLYDRMDAYLRDRNIIAEDLGWVKQILFNLLDPCENFQDMRDALPNCLSETMPQLSNLARTREEAWTIKDDARAMKQYALLLPKLELYSVSKLFF